MTKIIYVESAARIQSLSLSGKIMVRIADRFVVQWEELAKVLPVSSYFGVLI